MTFHHGTRLPGLPCHTSRSVPSFHSAKMGRHVLLLHTPGVNPHTRPVQRERESAIVHLDSRLIRSTRSRAARSTQCDCFAAAAGGLLRDPGVSRGAMASSELSALTSELESLHQLHAESHEQLSTAWRRFSGESGMFSVQLSWCSVDGRSMRRGMRKRKRSFSKAHWTLSLLDSFYPSQLG